MHRAGEGVAIERRVPRCVEHYGEGVRVGDRAVEDAHVLPEAQGGAGVRRGECAHEARDDGQRDVWHPRCVGDFVWEADEGQRVVRAS